MKGDSVNPYDHNRPLIRLHNYTLSEEGKNIKDTLTLDIPQWDREALYLKLSLQLSIYNQNKVGSINLGCLTHPFEYSPLDGNPAWGEN